MRGSGRNPQSEGGRGQAWLTCLPLKEASTLLGVSTCLRVPPGYDDSQEEVRSGSKNASQNHIQQHWSTRGETYILNADLYQRAATITTEKLHFYPWHLDKIVPGSYCNRTGGGNYVFTYTERFQDCVQDRGILKNEARSLPFIAQRSH